MPGLSEAPLTGCVRARPPDSLKAAMKTAAVVTAVCSVLGVGVNTLRPDGISLIRHTQYEILVPCPETTGETTAVAANDPVLGEKRTLLIDARPPAEHALWHPPGAMNVPFDYLEQVDLKTLRSIAASGAARVVVYGDGNNPDSGEHLAGEISGRGIRNVGFIPGGAASLKKSKPGASAP